jgi:hypothetical protein
MESEVVLTVALRVLASVTENCTPDEADLELLRQYTHERNESKADELACDVVWTVLKQREAGRAKSATVND